MEGFQNDAHTARISGSVENDRNQPPCHQLRTLPQYILTFHRKKTGKKKKWRKKKKDVAIESPCILNMNKAQSRSITAMNVLTMCRHMQPTMWRCYFQEKQIKINTLPLPLPPPILTQQQNRKKTKREKECVYCSESGRIVPKVCAGCCAPKRTLPPPPTMIFPIFSTQDKNSQLFMNSLINWFRKINCTRLENKTIQSEVKRKLYMCFLNKRPSTGECDTFFTPRLDATSFIKRQQKNNRYLSFLI